MDELANDEIDLREVVALLRRQFRLIVFSGIIGLGLALIYLFQVTPLYTASTLVLVDPTQKNLLNPDDRYLRPGTSEDAQVESEVEILKSSAVAMATVKELGLVRDPEFGPSIGLWEKVRRALNLSTDQTDDGARLLNGVLTRFSEATEVQRKRLTYLITVSVTSENPERAALMANTMARTYIDLQLQNKIAGSLAQRDVLQGQIVNSRNALAASEEALDNYIEAHLDRLELETGSTGISGLRDRLDRANDTLISTNIAISSAESALRSQDWTGLANTLGDEALAALSAQREELEAQLGRAATGSQTEFDLRARLAELDTSISSRAESSINSLRSNVTALEANARDTRSQIRLTVLQGDLSPTTLAEIYELQQEADIAQRQYSTLLSRLRDLETQALVQVADSRIVSEALPPQAPSFPNTRMILLLALLASLGGGVGLAFLNEYYVGGISSASQLENIIPARVATTIPNQPQNSAQKCVADAVIDTPLSVYAESCRRLRAAIDQGVKPKDRKALVIMVTSSIPAEGKTTLALALARTYAASGKRTFLIDTDLRKPSVHKYLGLDPESGFLEYLQDPTAFQKSQAFHVYDPRSRLNVIMGKGRSATPTDQLLQSDTFVELMDGARDSVDVIVLDTPPVGPVVDARYIARVADVVVHCVRFGLASQSDVRSAYQQLSESVRPGTPIFAVLSHDESKTTGYRYDGYYSDYYTD